MENDDWWEKHKANIDERASKIKDVEIDQGILFLKSAGVKAFNNNEDCTTFFDSLEKNKFGFTEHLVNKLMQLAYNEGAKAIDKTSYARGYNEAFEEVHSKLFGEKDCETHERELY